MIIQRTRIAPALGKGAEVEAQLADWVRSAQAEGKRVGLSRRILSSEGPMFVVTTAAPDVAAIDRIRQEQLASADFGARAARLAPLLREPPRTVLLESLTDMPTPNRPLTIVSLATAYPAPGKERQVIAITEEVVASGRAAGIAMAAFRRVFSSDGSTIALIARYADLAELDRTRKERAAIVAQASAAVSELSRAPISQRLTEVILPLPS